MLVFSDVEGSIALNIAKPEGAGMRLEDIPEAFCASCCSVEEEIRLRDMAEEVVQVWKLEEYWSIIFIAVVDRYSSKMVRKAQQNSRTRR